MSRRNLRIEIPRNPSDVIELGDAIVAKHTADGVASPLAVADVDAMKLLLQQVKDKNTLAEQLHRDAETATADRKTATGTAQGQNSSTPNTMIYYFGKFRNQLAGLFLGQEHRLGDWGYNVDTSPSSGGTPPPPPPGP
jgi:hypothetical protein